MFKKKPSRVLIVDEDNHYRETTRSALQKMGFKVNDTSDGSSIIEIILKKSPAVVLIDVEMINIIGNGTLREIRSVRPETRIIILAARADLEPVVPLLQRGIFDYLINSRDVDPLAERIRDAVKNRRGLVESEPRIRDVMVPLHYFRTIRKDKTVAESIMAIFSLLDRSATKLMPSESLYRSALVVDDSEKVLGVISFTSILREMQTSFRKVDKKRSSDSISAEPPDCQGLYTLLARDIGRKKVGDVISGVLPVIGPDESLTAALNAFLSLNVRHLVVMDGDETVGIVRDHTLFFETGKLLGEILQDKRDSEQKEKVPAMT